MRRAWLPSSQIFDTWTQETVYGGGCPEDVPPHQLPPNATNWILRESTGTAWFVNAESELQWIADGPTYVCLAQDYFVLDNTPWEEIVQFEATVYPGDVQLTC